MAVVVAAALACQNETSVSEPTQEVPAAAGRPTREELPKAVRPGLKSAMSRHAEQASALTRAVALGLREETVARATSLLDEARPAHPMPDDALSLNNRLPAALFERDEAFRAALVSLRKSADASNDDTVIAQFAGVLRACRDCHRSFGPPERAVRPADAGPNSTP